jgi:probable phosphoglycerate mutase
MTTLILVRHGLTEWNREGRIQGHSDSALTTEGIEQARSIGARLREEAIDLMVSSDLGRARHTATLIASDIGHEIGFDERLRERSFGVAEGLSYAEIQRDYPEMFSRVRETDPHFAVPGGETRAQFSQRVVSAIGNLAEQHNGKKLLVITHGGVLAAIYRWLNELPVSSPHKIEIPNVAYNRIHRDDQRWRIEVWGDTAHLPLETDADPL